MRQDEMYLGWTNRDTWLAYLGLTGSDLDTHSDAIRMARKYEDPLRFFIAMLDALGNPDDINYSRVNWQEVIAALRE